MKKILIFQWFECKDKDRKQELISCIKFNLNLAFDKIIIFNENVAPYFEGSNIENILTQSRLTYSDFIHIANNPENYGSMICLTNTDIKIDPNIFLINDVLENNQLIALSRYESNGEIAKSPWCTQDFWCIRSQPIHKSILIQSNIPLGIPGCENRFSEIMHSAGFEVFNPSLEIKNQHMHQIQASYPQSERLYGAYLFIPICTIDDIKQKNPAHYPSINYLTNPFSN